MDENKEKRTAEIAETAESINTEENGQGSSKRWGIFMIIVLIGFVLIYFLVTRAYGLIAAHFGRNAGRAIPLLLVAFFWYIWGQICLYIKNEYNID